MDFTGAVFTEAEMDSQKKAEAKRVFSASKKKLESLMENSAPGSVVRTVGIQRLQKDLDLLDRFIRACDFVGISD